jgi:hypothetical protein
MAFVSFFCANARQLLSKNAKINGAFISQSYICTKTAASRYKKVACAQKSYQSELQLNNLYDGEKKQKQAT